MSLGSRIKEVREDKGWSQPELADKIGVQYQHISRWERDASTPSADYLIKIGEACGVSLDWLLTGKGEMRGLEVYDLAPASMNIDGEQTYMTNQGPMAFSDICSSMSISPHDFNSWLETHHKDLREKYKNLEKLIREEKKEVLEVRETAAQYEATSKNFRLLNLIGKLEHIYNEGSFDIRAKVRGIIEEAYDDIIKSKDTQKKEVIEQKKVS